MIWNGGHRRGGGEGESALQARRWVPHCGIPGSCTAYQRRTPPGPHWRYTCGVPEPLEEQEALGPEQVPAGPQVGADDLLEAPQGERPQGLEHCGAHVLGGVPWVRVAFEEQDRAGKGSRTNETINNKPKICAARKRRRLSALGPGRIRGTGQGRQG